MAAIEADERITVHGDFDVDGVCATAILVGTLRDLGAECDWLIPDRIADGYGLRPRTSRKLAERGTSLIVTVDCGITAVAEVALAKELGMEVIVTDHHQAGDELPDCPILHPGLDGLSVRRALRDRGGLEACCALRAGWIPTRGGLARGGPDPTSIWSRWRRWLMWCRWSARTGRW